jgi:hypothetical protein
MYDLIGMPYRLGADGTDGQIDCIHVVYRVQEELGIPVPEFKQSWYEASRFTILRDLLTWGHKVDGVKYDGDIALLPAADKAFAIVWNQGILYIHALTEKVAWSPLAAAQQAAHFFRGNAN